MELPPVDSGVLKTILVCSLLAVATGLVGALGFARLAVPPIILAHVLPLYTCISPAEPQFEHHICKPATGASMAFFWI
jgi:hypothetical protein